MTSLQTHAARGFAIAALWAPLAWYVCSLAGQWPASTPLRELPLAQLAGAIVLIALPTLAMRILVPANPGGGER